MSEHNDILQYAMEMGCEALHMVVDPPTGLKGVIAIHSTQLGPALGGCRWLDYPTTTKACVDAIRLAQGMSYKASISGLNLGGGKTVLLKPKEPIDRKSYFEAFGRFLNKMGGSYITAVDVGTTIDDMDVINTVSDHVTSTTHGAYSTPDPSSLTAFGVIRGMEAAVEYKLGKKSLEGVHVAVQGLGHVGTNIVRFLHERGAQITVADIKPDAVQKMVDTYQAKGIHNPKDILTIDCDVFCPCALGQAINEKSIPILKAPIVAGAANNQLEEPEDGVTLHQKGILYAPDFAINAGGLIYVAGQHAKHTEEETRDKISNLYQVLMDIFKRSDKENVATSEVAYTIAKERMNHG